jgi:hypothetical protein
VIAFPRSLARQFRAVLRRCVHRDSNPFVLVRSSRKGLTLEAVSQDVALRVEFPGGQENAALAFPTAVLAQFEGRHDDLVTLHESSPGNGQATWKEAGTPTSRDFKLVQPDAHLSFPRMPEVMKSPGAGFLRALHDASQTAAQQVATRSLDWIMLRGRTGEVIATDGRQLLLQGGFNLPWKDDRLVRSLNAWGSRELPEEEAQLGCNDKQVFVRMREWTFALMIADNNRYPAVEKVIPPSRSIKTRLQLHPDDISLLIKDLPRLPEGDDRDLAVTLDIDKEVCIRTRASGKEEIGELKLASPRVTGLPVRTVMNRTYLLRALKLGFTEIEIAQADKPLCCRDSKRVFIWMPLTDPPAKTTPATQQPNYTTESKKEETPMPDPNGSSKHPVNGDSSHVNDPLAEAEAIRALLTEAHSRLSRLIAALKQHRRQARAVHAAVRSLQELPPLIP